MTSSPNDPFDPAQDLADAPRDGGVQRPKDAATLILLRPGKTGDEILMGRRADGHVFMASKWVFPGGRIDRADFTSASATDLSEQTTALLAQEMPARRARALGLAAVRETFEETGLIVGRAAAPASVAGPWRAFRKAGALPDLGALTYVARAITPPGRTRRFDARFFLASAEALLHPEPTAGSGELDRIAWLPLEEAQSLDLPAITRFVLGEVIQRQAEPQRPVPFVRQIHGRHQVVRL